MAHEYVALRAEIIRLEQRNAVLAEQAEARGRRVIELAAQRDALREQVRVLTEARQYHRPVVDEGQS